MTKNLTRTAAIGMTVVMAVCTTGCGKQKDTKDTTTEKSVSEYSYTVEYTDLTALKGSWIYDYALDGDTFYYATEKYDSKTSISTLSVYSMNLSAPEDVKEYITYQGGDTYSYGISALHPLDDGQISFVKTEYTYNADAILDSSDTDLGDVSENDLITEEIIANLGYNLEDIGLEFSDVDGMKVSEFLTIYNQLTGNTSGDEEYIDNKKCFLVTVGADGTEVSSTDITSQMQGIYLSTCTWVEDTAYTISTTWDDVTDEETSTLISINATTGEISAQETDEAVEQLMVTGNGTLLGLGYNEDYDYVLKKYDSASGSFSDIKDSGITGYWIESAAPAGDNSFCYICDGSLYLYDLSENKDSKLLSFVDCNVSGDSYPVMIYTDEEHITVITEDYSSDDETYTLNKLTRVKTAEMKEKTEITLGCFISDDTLQKAIVNFNKSNPDYKIVLKTYYDWDSDEDYEDALSRFNDDILAGTAPDLIDLGAVDVSEYSGKGLFADLYPYLNADSDFAGKELQENILKLCEDNGALYALPATYTISGLASAKDLLGDDGLTLEKFAEIIENNPDKTMLSSDTTRDSILNKLYLYNKSYFVDETAKTCNFTDGKFEKLLEIAKSFPTQDEADEAWDDDSYVSEPKKVADGNQLFYGLSLYDFGEYQVAASLFNNNFNVTGYPSVNGNSVAVTISSSMYAINANSAYKDQCWSFIKQIFEDTTSSSWYNGFAVDKEVFEKQLADAATVSMTTDENGNEVEESKGTYGFQDDFEIDIYALTDEEVANIRELVDAANVLVPSNSTDEIYDIISEEVEAYYSGEKSAADVCSIIQSRANILVNENN